MSYSCKILLDSISETGKRLTTFEITFPRIVLAEFNTHRMFSRNSASSRAIPFEKQIDRIYADSFIPEQFPLNCKGMQPQEYVTKNDSRYKNLVNEWLNARSGAICQARILRNANVHKQITNRLLEPFMWHTVVVTATEFDNFFKLRCNENAQYEIRRIADLMYEAYHAFENYNKGNVSSFVGMGGTISSEGEFIDSLIEGKEWSAIRPQKLKVGEWHCPLVSEEDRSSIATYFLENREPCLKQFKYDEFVKIYGNYPEDWYQYCRKELIRRISVARCARVSYLTHDGKRDIEKDLELFEKLRTSGHWSPFEHVATPYYIDKNSHATSNALMLPEGKLHFDGQVVEGYICNDKNGYYNFDLRNGNFIGWKQYRKEFKDENWVDFRKE